MSAGIPVRVPIGDDRTVHALVTRPAGGPRSGAAVVLAHGAGGDIDEPTLLGVHEAAVALGMGAVRFRFPYRDSGRRAPDPPHVLEAAFRDVVRWVRSSEGLSSRQLVCGGRSLGGRIASLLVVGGEPVDGLLFLSYPLHPAGQPEKLRDAHLYVIQRPMLFVQGDRDALAVLDRLQPVVTRLGERATLHLVADGDHSLRVRRRSGRTTEEARAEAVEAARAWLRRVV